MRKPGVSLLWLGLLGGGCLVSALDADRDPVPTSGGGMSGMAGSGGVLGGTGGAGKGGMTSDGGEAGSPSAGSPAAAGTGGEAGAPSLCGTPLVSTGINSQLALDNLEDADELIPVRDGRNGQWQVLGGTGTIAFNSAPGGTSIELTADAQPHYLAAVFRDDGCPYDVSALSGLKFSAQIDGLAASDQFSISVLTQPIAEFAPSALTAVANLPQSATEWANILLDFEDTVTTISAIVFTIPAQGRLAIDSLDFHTGSTDCPQTAPAVVGCSVVPLTCIYGTVHCDCVSCSIASGEDKWTCGNMSTLVDYSWNGGC